MEKFNIKVDFKRPVDINVISSEILEIENQIEIDYITSQDSKKRHLFLEKRTMGPVLSMRFLPIGMATGIFLYTSIVYEKSETLQSALYKMSPLTLLIFMLLGGLLMQALGFILGSRSVTHVLKYQKGKDSDAQSILLMNTNEKIKDNILKVLLKFKPERIDVQKAKSEARLEYRT